MAISAEELDAIRQHARATAEAAPEISERVAADLRPLLQVQEPDRQSA